MEKLVSGEYSKIMRAKTILACPTKCLKEV